MHHLDGTEAVDDGLAVPVQDRPRAAVRGADIQDVDRPLGKRRAPARRRVEGAAKSDVAREAAAVERVAHP